MNTFKPLTIIFLSAILIACGSNSGQAKLDFDIKTNAENGIIHNNETLNLSIEIIKLIL